MRPNSDGVALSPFADQSHTAVSKHPHQGGPKKIDPPHHHHPVVETPSLITPNTPSEVTILPVVDPVSNPVSPPASDPVPSEADQPLQTRAARDIEQREELEAPTQNKTGLWVSLGILGATGAGLVAGTYYATRKREKFTKVETTEMTVDQLISADILDFENPDVRTQKGYRETSKQWE
jgi:uncharacterized membrane protein